MAGQTAMGRFPSRPMSTWEMTHAAAVAAISEARRLVMHDWREGRGAQGGGEGRGAGGRQSAPTPAMLIDRHMAVRLGMQGRPPRTNHRAGRAAHAPTRQAPAGHATMRQSLAGMAMAWRGMAHLAVGGLERRRHAHQAHAVHHAHASRGAHDCEAQAGMAARGSAQRGVRGGRQGATPQGPPD